MLPLTTLLTGADTGTAADDIWQRILLTSADGRIVEDDVPQQSMVAKPWRAARLAESRRSPLLFVLLRLRVSACYCRQPDAV